MRTWAEAIREAIKKLLAMPADERFEPVFFVFVFVHVRMLFVPCIHIHVGRRLSNFVSAPVSLVRKPRFKACVHATAACTYMTCAACGLRTRARAHTHTHSLSRSHAHTHTQIYQSELETNGELQENMMVRLKDLSADGALGKYNDALATVVEVNER